MNAPTPGPDNPHAVHPIPEQAPPTPFGTVDPSAAVLVAQVTCPSCGVVASYTFGHRAPDVCQSCGQPYQFTTERRVELDEATGDDPAGLAARASADPARGWVVTGDAYGVLSVTPLNGPATEADAAWLRGLLATAPLTDEAKLAETARRLSALGDVLYDLNDGAASEEVDVCRDLARVLTDPAYRNQTMTDDVFARVAAAILGEVDPR